MSVGGSMLLLLLSAMLMTGTMAEYSKFVQEALKVLGKRGPDDSADVARSRGMLPEEIERLELICHKLHISHERTITEEDMGRIIDFFDYNGDGTVDGQELLQMKRFFENFDECLRMAKSGM